jgi:hypothetical protein
VRLRFAGQGRSDDARQPQCVVGDIAIRGGVAAGDEVSFVVHDRHDRENEVETLRPLRSLGNPQWDSGGADLALGPYDPLGGRRLGAERGTRDLRRGEAAHRPQRQRQLRLG